MLLSVCSILLSIFGVLVSLWVLVWRVFPVFEKNEILEKSGDVKRAHNLVIKKAENFLGNDEYGKTKDLEDLNIEFVQYHKDYYRS